MLLKNKLVEQYTRIILTILSRTNTGLAKMSAQKPQTSKFLKRQMGDIREGVLWLFMRLSFYLCQDITYNLASTVQTVFSDTAISNMST